MGRQSTVSAVVYSRNEADLLPDCLAAVQDFDEVLVCDMQSTDATRAVAESFGARVVPVPDAPVVEEVRQLGLEASTSDWVLFVDADEHLPAGFRDAVQTVIDGEPTLAAVRLRYANVAFGVPLEHTLQGSAKYALVRVGRTRYDVPARAHVPPHFDGGVVDAPESVPEIPHLNFRTVEQSVEKILRYAANVPARDSRVDGPFALVRELARTTVFSGVWRDGRAGFAVVALHVFGRFYSNLLAAEEAGELDDRFGRETERRLGFAAGTHRALLGIRDLARRLARRGRA